MQKYKNYNFYQEAIALNYGCMRKQAGLGGKLAGKIWSAARPYVMDATKAAVRPIGRGVYNTALAFRSAEGPTVMRRLINAAPRAIAGVGETTSGVAQAIPNAAGSMARRAMVTGARQANYPGLSKFLRARNTVGNFLDRTESRVAGNPIGSTAMAYVDTVAPAATDAARAAFYVPRRTPNPFIGTPFYGA